MQWQVRTHARVHFCTVVQVVDVPVLVIQVLCSQFTSKRTVEQFVEIREEQNRGKEGVRWRNPRCFWFWCTRSFLLLLGGYLHHRSSALFLCLSQEDAVHLEQVAAVETLWKPLAWCLRNSRALLKRLAHQSLFLCNLSRRRSLHPWSGSTGSKWHSSLQQSWLQISVKQSMLCAQMLVHEHQELSLWSSRGSGRGQLNAAPCNKTVQYREESAHMAQTIAQMTRQHGAVLIQQQANVTEATTGAQTAEQEHADMARIAARLAARPEDGGIIDHKAHGQPFQYHASQNDHRQIIFVEAIFTN